MCIRARRCKATASSSIDDGVTFASHLDGARYRMTPEESMRVQMLLGADIIMAFDECPPGTATRDFVQRAMDRTTKWLARSKAAMTRVRNDVGVHVKDIAERYFLPGETQDLALLFVPSPGHRKG